MLEWLKRHAWKACNRQNRFAGSNPVLSAMLRESSWFPFLFSVCHQLSRLSFIYFWEGRIRLVISSCFSNKPLSEQYYAKLSIIFRLSANAVEILTKNNQKLALQYVRSCTWFCISLSLQNIGLSLVYRLVLDFCFFSPVDTGFFSQAQGQVS